MQEHPRGGGHGVNNSEHAERRLRGKISLRGTGRTGGHMVRGSPPRKMTRNLRKRILNRAVM